ncbi:MAG: ribonuclease P protein subunit [Candidatus Woesearchaeota archaeon]|nr:MAG: ribonuclease P protein subunit [Candidatus Woesearchaeota archaeon]
MKKNPREILGLGLIGKNVEVITSRNSALVGLRGKVVEETKNTLTINSGSKEKKIIKEQAEIKIIFKEDSIKIKGNLLVGKPEERLKKKR